MRARFAKNIVGVLESSGGVLRGWALDVRPPHEPISVRVMIDGQAVTEVKCNKSRQDLVEAGWPTERAGFEFTVPSLFLDGGSHTVKFVTDSNALIKLADMNGEPKAAWKFRITRGDTGEELTPLMPKKDQSASGPGAKNEGNAIEITRNMGPSADPQLAAVEKDGAARFHSTRFGFDTITAGSEAARSIVEVTGNRVWDLVATEFDAEFYTDKYREEVDKGASPLVDYCERGWRMSRNPNAWFDTKFYLACNPDVAEADVDPFWHYLTAGRAEGRRPAQKNKHLREALDKAVPAEEKLVQYMPPDVFSSVLPEHFARLIQEALEGAAGFVCSLSHDCYIRSVGGVQILVSDEQKKFAERGFLYLHISPYVPRLALADDSAEPFHLQVVLNGFHVGVVLASDLIRVLSILKEDLPAHTKLIFHCILGHKISFLLHLFDALGEPSSFFWLHDYSSLCTGFTLLRNDISYCGAPTPDSRACGVCVYGDSRLSHLEGVRRLFEHVPLEVVSPSRAALEIWERGNDLPYKKAFVHEHCIFQPTRVRRTALKSNRGVPGRPVRVAFVGAPLEYKGYGLFLELVDRLRVVPQYKFFHACDHSGLARHGGVEPVSVRVTQENRGAMIEALEAATIDLVLVLSRCPETFSFVTYEALAAGADVVTLKDSGNVSSLVLSSGRGVVVADPAALIEFFQSGRAIAYVRLCHSQGSEAGDLLHTGTSATIHEAAESVAQSVCDLKRKVA